MKYKHVFWGIVLIAIGVLFILNNVGVFEFGWRTLWSLWPLILIFWGISILPVKEWMKITGLVVVLAFTIIFFQRLTDHAPWFHFRNFDHGHWHGDWDSEDEDEDDNSPTANYQEQHLSVPFDSVTRKGILTLDAAAGNFKLMGVTNDFLDFNKKGYIGDYSLTTSDANAVKCITLKTQESHIKGGLSNNQVDIKINEKPSWNFNFDIGAAEIIMDLSMYKIDTATLNAGASSMDIKLGEKNPLSVWTFNAGASSIKINIPKNSGCQVYSESFMVSKEFDGFEKKGDRTYQTMNFAGSKNKIYITIKTAISKIEITRY
jgi:hypothetical protein